MPNLPLLNLLSMKAVAWSLAGLVAAGGAATAGTVAFSSSGSTPTNSVDTGAQSANSGDTVPAAAPADTSAANSAAPAAASGSAPLTATQLCTDLTSRVASTIGDAGGAANAAGLAQILANPAVTDVLSTAPVNGLVGMVDNATAVPDYCGLVLALPTVPVPNTFTQIPTSLLNQALTTLPAAASLSRLCFHASAASTEMSPIGVGPNSGRRWSSMICATR